MQILQGIALVISSVTLLLFLVIAISPAKPAPKRPMLPPPLPVTPTKIQFSIDKDSEGRYRVALVSAEIDGRDIHVQATERVITAHDTLTFTLGKEVTYS